MNFDAFTPSRLAAIQGQSRRSPALSVATVRDFCATMDLIPELATIQQDLKDAQRPWVFQAILAHVPRGGRILEIGAGEPHVAELLVRAGYEVWVVDPYDGSGRGPTEFEAFVAKHPGIRIIRAQFGTQLTDVPAASFDAVYSISVLEHIPHSALPDVLAMARRCVKPGGVHIHAVDHVYLGEARDYHLQTLKLVAEELALPSGSVDSLIDTIETNPDVYFLSAESHNRWRGAQPYDAFPMRRCISIQYVVPAPAADSAPAAPPPVPAAVTAAPAPAPIPSPAPLPSSSPAENSADGNVNPWNNATPFDYSGLWFGTTTVVENINRRISGSPSVSWLEYGYRTYMARKSEGRCLILGANFGHVQRDLRKWGFRGPIVASDIAATALEKSKELDRTAGITGVDYLVADLNVDSVPGKFDFIIAEGVLHHIEKTERCIRHLNDALTDDGLLIGVEFEGPFRFQLPPEQLQWINAALAVMPMELRPQNGGVRGTPPPLSYLSWNHYVKPSIEEMLAYDPSEAVGGPALKALMPVVFRMKEKKGYGGTLLSYMSCHFPFNQANSNPYVDKWMRVLMAIEDTVIGTGLLQDDFVFYVAEKRLPA